MIIWIALFLTLLLVPMIVRDVGTLIRLLGWTIKVLVLIPVALLSYLSQRSDRRT